MTWALSGFSLRYSHVTCRLSPGDHLAEPCRVLLAREEASAMKPMQVSTAEDVSLLDAADQAAFIDCLVLAE